MRPAIGVLISKLHRLTIDPARHFGRHMTGVSHSDGIEDAVLGDINGEADTKNNGIEVILFNDDLSVPNHGLLTTGKRTRIRAVKNRRG